MITGKHTLNIAPVDFSRATLAIGWVDYVDDVQYEKLRQDHRETHVCRFDSRTRRIANVTLQPGLKPLGEVEEDAPANRNLLLLGKAVQASLLGWLVKNKRKVLRFSKPIIFLGSKARTKLLSAALEELTPSRP